MKTPYNESFYEEQKHGSLQSAEIIIPFILNHFPVASVIDVGCGVGTWLSIFERYGVKNIKGFDANDLSPSNYFIDKAKIQTNCDFSSSTFKLNDKADMIICLEVAEHIPESAANNLIHNLVNSSFVIIFSAAYPDQTGTNHINEQPPWYWREKFNNVGYIEIDFIRPAIWFDERISWWYRQNMTSFVHPRYIETNDRVHELAERYGQKPGPHRLTLVNEWILKNQFQHQSILINNLRQEIIAVTERLKTLNESQKLLNKLIDKLKGKNISSPEFFELGEMCYKIGRTEDAKYFFEQGQALRHINTNNHKFESTTLRDDEYRILNNSSPKAVEAATRVNNTEGKDSEITDKIDIVDQQPAGKIDGQIQDKLIFDTYNEPGIEKDKLSSIHNHSSDDQDHLIFTHLTREEKLKLYELAKNTSGTIFVELGSYIGASSCFIAKGLRDSNNPGKLYCIDTWANEGMAEGLRDTYNEFINNTSHYKDIIIPLRGKSADIAKDFNEEIDFLFVDCDHSYEGVKNDVEKWFPKLRQGAVVIFHDIGWAEGVQKVIIEMISPIVTNENRLPNMYWARLQKPFLSVIFPTRNRGRLLEKVLESLKCQTYPAHMFELIVVDNGSTDNTAEICKKYEQQFTNFKYLYDENPGLHVGRHLGCKEARGSILVYGDDDIEAFPTWLEGVAESFQDPSVGLVGGKILPKFESEPPPWFNRLISRTPWGHCLGWYSILNFGDAIREISPLFVWGCNFSIRKDVLLEIGGFHPDSVPKELLVFRGDGETFVSQEIARKGHKTIYNPKASVYHLVSNERMTLEYLYYRAYIQGISDSYSQIRSTKTANSYKQFISCSDELQDTINKGLADGFNFHQDAVKKSPELLKWVLKEDYFYYKLPQI